MSEPETNVEFGEARRRSWLRRKLVPLLTLLLIIAISVVLFLYERNPGTVARLGKYRYLGAFLISLIGNATVLLPGVVLPILTTLGAVFYKSSGSIVEPIIVGLVGGAGAAIGEIVGYTAGYAGASVVRNRKLYDRSVGWIHRWGVLAVFIFALVPLFFDLVGLAAGVLRFPLWKFIVSCWLGRTVLYVTFVVLAAMGLKVVFPWLG